MKLILTKSILHLANGDREIIRERRVVTDLETERKAMQKSKLNCMYVEFEYETLPE